MTNDMNCFVMLENITAPVMVDSNPSVGDRNSVSVFKQLASKVQVIKYYLQASTGTGVAANVETTYSTAIPTKGHNQ